MVDEPKPNPEASIFPPRETERGEVANVLKNPLNRLRDCASIQKLENEKLSGYEVLQIDVNNREVWKSQENEDALVRLFGKLSTVAFAPRDRKIDWNPDDQKIYQEAVANLNEIRESDRVFAVMRGGEVVGFVSSLTSEGPQKMRVADLMLTVVDPDLRGAPIAKELTQLCFEQTNVDAFVAISHTPAAVKNFLAAARGKNLTPYFCSQKNGEWGNSGDESERAKMLVLDEHVKESYSKEYPGRVIDGEVGYVGITRTDNPNEIQPIPPVKREELQFKNDDSLKETFEKGLLAQNAKHAPHTIYGTLIAFKENKAE